MNWVNSVNRQLLICLNEKEDGTHAAFAVPDYTIESIYWEGYLNTSKY